MGLMKIKVPLFIAHLSWPKAQVLITNHFGDLRRCTVRKGPNGWELGEYGHLSVLDEGGNLRGHQRRSTWEPYRAKDPATKEELKELWHPRCS